LPRASARGTKNKKQNGFSHIFIRLKPIGIFDLSSWLKPTEIYKKIKIRMVTINSKQMSFLIPSHLLFKNTILHIYK